MSTHESLEVSRVGSVVPKASIKELQARRTDPEFVTAFTEDLLEQIQAAVQQRGEELRDGEAYGIESLVEAYERFGLTETNPHQPLPAQIYLSLSHNIYINLKGFISEEWLEQNPLVEEPIY
jgi:hypothetical protein